MNGDATDVVDGRGETSKKPVEASNLPLDPDHSPGHPRLPRRDSGPSAGPNPLVSSSPGGTLQSPDGRFRTREMLERIAWLSAESVRASEEKLALATTAYNSVEHAI